SGTATGTYSAGTHTITCTAGTLTCTVAGSVTRADLRVKRDGSTLPAYQAVVNANNYDTVGFPLFLKRDLVDDNMMCQVPAGGITGTFAIGTIDGPIFGTRALPAGEAYPLWNDNATFGPSTYTQLIHLNTVLDSDDQEVFERFVYSRAKQLIDVDQFGGASSFLNFFRGTLAYSTRLLTLNVSNFDTRNVKTFGAMAYDNYNLVISGIDALEVTSKVVNIGSMFLNNKKLTTIDISGWDLSGATFVNYLFGGCNMLTNVIVGTAFDNCPCIVFTSAFSNTNLNQASIDAILVSINNAGTSNGTFDQSGGSAPSATGEAAIMAMRSRGWTVTVTGGF
ncbi:MAG: BspA family leucine-rich repeat surface protein, partial [Desulfomicrobium apsheronum]|nr:BspA family leucine-rich repeat surface protein [Desulfomicrobium apsheronum]